MEIILRLERSERHAVEIEFIGGARYYYQSRVMGVVADAKGNRPILSFPGALSYADSFEALEAKALPHLQRFGFTRITIERGHRVLANASTGAKASWKMFDTRVVEVAPQS